MATDWVRLDEDRADYGAIYGKRMQGEDGVVTLLELPSGSVAIVGHMSCASRADAERLARKCTKHEADRHITRALFDSWRADA